MRRPRIFARRRQHESGSSLIEVLVAVVIMGIAFVIIVGGIGIAIIGAETQKEQAATDVALHTAAESISYVPCTTPTYQDELAALPDLDPDITIAITKVSYWNGADRFRDDIPCVDSGLHLIELRATSTSGRTTCRVAPDGNGPATCEPLQVVKRRP